MKTVILILEVLAIGFFLFVFMIPIHELGHVLVAVIAKGPGVIRDISWFSFPGFVWGYIQLNEGLGKWGDWFLSLGGGLFQGLLFLLASVVLRKTTQRKISRHWSSQLIEISRDLLFYLAVVGFIYAVFELLFPQFYGSF